MNNIALKEFSFEKNLGIGKLLFTNISREMGEKETLQINQSIYISLTEICIQIVSIPKEHPNHFFSFLHTPF